MKKISTLQFGHTIKDIQANSQQRKFCFVLGAGASYASGIPTGGKLAEKWYKEIIDRYPKKEITEWEKKIKLDKKDLAASYGSIYKKRFEIDKASGYEFLIQAMKEAKPTFGHIALAKILTETKKGHCVLTTNFDSLVETSIYQFTNKTPLVCGHESLSGYARPSEIHPLIVKIHRDLLLNPKSDEDDIEKLDNGWVEPLNNIFGTHIPIVIGYGGNDGSLMSYFEAMNKPSNFFWCELIGNQVSDRVKNLLTAKGGILVEIEGFDELLFEILFAFGDMERTKNELEEITNNRITSFNTQFKALENKLRTIDNGSNRSVLEYFSLIDSKSNIEEKEKNYLEALESYPDSFALNGEYARFLHESKKDYEKAEKYYLKALFLDSDNEDINGNYAVFLNDIIKDYDQAEKYYLKALFIEPNDSIFNGNYAQFLKNTRKDYENAEKYYLKALSLDPEDAIFNENYAVFLNYIRKDEGAEEYYLKALSLDPDHVDFNGNYANFLSDIKKDYKSAEKYYLKALSLKPDDENINGNYAYFLLINKRKKEAEKYLNQGFQLNNNERDDLQLELWFYRYAHFPEYLEEAEKEIESLLEEGLQSIGWNLQPSVDLAIEEKHPNPKKIKEFAKRITTVKD